MKRKSLVFFLIAIIWGCSSKDTTPVFTGEMPASALIASKQISIFKYNNSYNGAALGYELKVTADGHVTGLGCASPAIGKYTLTIFKVDTVNKTGSQIALLPIEFTAADTASFKFKYVYLTEKKAISKGNYYRVSINGDFTSYNYMTFPAGSKYSLPLACPTNQKIIFTKGIAGSAMTYPASEFTTYMFPADVVLQFP